MRLGTFVKGAGIVVVAVVIASIAVVKSIDFNSYKDFVSEQVKSATGRDLIIQGDLDLKLGFTPSVRIEGVSFANGKGFSDAPMARLDSVVVELALLPLFVGDVTLKKVLVSGGEIRIETNASGQGNWVMTPETADQNAQAGQESAKSEESPPPTSFDLREVKISDTTIIYADGVAKRKDELAFKVIDILPDQAGGTSSLLVKGALNGENFDITGLTGSVRKALGGGEFPVKLTANLPGILLALDGKVQNLMAQTGVDLRLNASGAELGKVLALGGLTLNGKPYEIGAFKLATHLSDASGTLDANAIDVALGRKEQVLLTAKGMVKDLKGQPSVDVALDAQSQNLAGLSTLAQSELPAIGPVALAGKIKGSDLVWKLTDLNLAVAESKITGHMDADLSGKVVKVNGALNAPLIRLNDFSAPAAPANQGAASQAPKAAEAKPTGKVFTADPLPLDTLKGVDANLALKVVKLDLDGKEITDLGGSIRLKNGILEANPFGLTVGGGRIDTTLKLDGAKKTPALNVKVKGDAVDLGKFVGTQLVSGGRTKVNIDLKGQGVSMAAIMGNLNGQALIEVGEGKVHNRAINWLGGDVIMQILGSLNPFTAGKDYTPMECAVVRFDVKNGKALTPKGIAVELDSMYVVGDGQIDLKSEQIDLSVRPTPRGGVGMSIGSAVAGLTKIGGTLAEPGLTIDALGTAKTAASLAASIATGGLSTLGEMALDKIMTDYSPCDTALGKVKNGPAPKAAPTGR